MMFSLNNHQEIAAETKSTPGKSQPKGVNLRKSFHKRTNLLGLWLFLLLNIGGLGLVLVIQLVSLVYTGRIANKPEAVLVEKADGRAVLVDAIPSYHRTPKAIQRFTSDILTAMFTITPLSQSTQPFEQTGAPDPGIKVAQVSGTGNDRVSVNAYVAVLAAVSPEFRDAFLAKLASITPSSAFNGNTQVLFKLDFLGEPIPVEGKPGEWTITVVGARYIVAGDSSPQTVLKSLASQPFRQVFYLKSVTPQFDPLPNIATDLQKSIFSITQVGLQITKMIPLDTSTPQGGDFLELPN